MARPLPSDYQTIDVLRFASDRPTVEAYELDLLENINFLNARTFNPHVTQHWQSDPANGPYIEPTGTSYVLNGIWRRRVPGDAAQWEFYHRLENGGTASASIKTELASDAATYNDVRTIAAGTAAAYVGPYTLSLDNSQTRDTIRLYTKETGTGAALRIHGTSIQPAELTSIPAGKSNNGITPFDTTEADVNEPLTPYHRQVLALDALDAMYDKRTDDIVGWSENWNVRSGFEAYSTTSATNVLMAKIPFNAAPGQDTIEWSATGFHDATGSGVITCETGYMQSLGTSQTITLTNKTASPYTSNIHDGTDLVCLPNKSDFLYVYLKGNGTQAAYLMGLCAWFAEL